MIKTYIFTLIFLMMAPLAPASGQQGADLTKVQEDHPSVSAEPDPSGPAERAIYDEVQSLNAGGLDPEVQLYNLAIVDAQRGQAPLAMARLRQSLYLKPTFKEARRALAWVQDQHAQPSPPNTNFEKIRAWLWLHQPAWVYPAGTLLTLFVGMWLLLGWIERLRQNRAQDLEPPAVPISMPILLFLAVLLAGIWSLRSWDRNFVERATYLGETGLKVNPSEEAPEVAPLPAGAEVILERSHEEWILARQPGGATGWILEEDLYITTAPPTTEDLSKH